MLQASQGQLQKYRKYFLNHTRARKIAHICSLLLELKILQSLGLIKNCLVILHLQIHTQYIVCYLSCVFFFFFFQSSGIGEASVYHALVVIFLEFFAWGLLTMPIISVLNETFPDHTFLMNGLIMGIKGILSFLSAPLIGALSDVWGRKFFLLITVAFTCAPIPLMSINTWWFFAMISISGVFACTFSVVFAYVADVTEENQRSLAYGLVRPFFCSAVFYICGFRYETFVSRKK